MLDLKECKVRWDKENYIPKKVYEFRTEPKKGKPKEIAKKFLKENLDSLKIALPMKDLRFERTVESLGASTVLFQQYFEGEPIHGAWVAIHLDKQNRIFMVKNDTIPILKLKQNFTKTKRAEDSLSENKIDKIIKKKIKELGKLDTKIKKEPMIYAQRGKPRYVWKVKFGTKNPAASWILFIDCITGQIVDERNVLRKINSKGRVFRPNPVVTLNRDDLYDKRDSNQAVFKRAYRDVKLKNLKSGGYLKGSYVDTTNTPNSARSSDKRFLYNRRDNEFEEVMAYYHIDAIQRYIQSLGFKGSKAILNRSIKVNAHGTREDSSYYDPSPGRKDLTFGDGGVDDAEDADVILHEYGHAVQDAIVPGFGQTIEGAAMGEGFSDYLAATFFSRFKRGDRKLRIAEWDAKGYQEGDRDWLRRIDSDKHYPEDMEGEEHADGEIWSACLWEVRRRLGKKRADTVILESHYYLNQYADFQDGAEAIILAEQNLYGGKKTRSLKRIFKRRGILQ